MQGSALGLFGHGDLAEDAGVSAEGPGSGTGTFRGVTMSINVDSPGDVDEVYVADPDGNLWEIAHNPHMPNDADGRVTFADG